MRYRPISRPATEPGTPTSIEIISGAHLGTAAAASRAGAGRLYGQATAFFVVAALALAWPWLSGAVTIPWDAKAHFAPQISFLVSSLARGESPFWAPFVFAGQPQVADPQALIFSPPYFLLALIEAAPSFRAMDTTLYATLFAGALALMGLFRDRGWHAGGALVAALVFAFGAAAAWRIQHVGQILSLAYLPMALWALERGLDRASARWGALAGVFAGLMVLGRDQVAYMGIWLLTGRVLWFWFVDTGDRRGVIGSLRPLLAGAVAGTAVALVPIALTLLFYESSNRTAIDLAGAGRGSLHPASLLTAFAANLFGTDGPFQDFWGPPSPLWGHTGLYLARNMGQVYVGALPLVLILGVGLTRRVLWAREVRFFTIAFIAVLLYGLGRYTPFFAPVFEWAPGGHLFRRPADATFLIGALAAVLAGYCAHRVLSGTAPALNARHWLALTGMLGAGLGMGLLLAVSCGTVHLAAWPLLTALAWLMAAAVLLALAARWSASRPGLLCLAFGLMLAGDLAANNGPNESTALPPAAYDMLRPDTTNETITQLKRLTEATRGGGRRDRVELAALGFPWPNASLVHGLDNTLGYNPVRLRRYSEATGAGDHVAVPEQRQFSPLMPSYHSLLADMLGLRYIATGVPIEEIDKRLVPGEMKLIARTGDGYIYENPGAMPRVMLVADAQPADFRRLMRTGEWPLFDPHRTVLLEAGTPVRRLPMGAADLGGQAVLKDYRNTRVVVTADAPQGGYVVLNDVWHPWWRATVDGAPAEILKANAIFRAVRVPPGRHEVVFSFAPFSGAWAQLKRMLGWR